MSRRRSRSLKQTKLVRCEKWDILGKCECMKCMKSSAWACIQHAGVCGRRGRYICDLVECNGGLQGRQEDATSGDMVQSLHHVIHTRRGSSLGVLDCGQDRQSSLLHRIHGYSALIGALDAVGDWSTRVLYGKLEDSGRAQ